MEYARYLNSNYSKKPLAELISWLPFLVQFLLLYTWQEILLFKYPAAALIVTNALMMTTPLDALAQTCEPETSVFNMPLLLLVALIGATVGGKVLMFLTAIVLLHSLGLSTLKWQKVIVVR